MYRLISKDYLERLLSKAERILNFIGYIPVISTFSARIRSAGGILQMVLGLLLAAYYFLRLRFSGARNIKHVFHLKASICHIPHGLCNVIRAEIESIPFLSLVICLPYDHLYKKRFKYDVENSPDIEVETNTIDI